MIALFGGTLVRCAKYAPGGTTELASVTLEALGQSHAVLLGNYCALTTGATLEAALLRARELETLARLYAIALSVGRPAILADEEVGRLAERLKSNGFDIESRIAPPVKARAKAKAKSRAKAKAPAKRKRVARKRGSKLKRHNASLLKRPVRSSAAHWGRIASAAP
jgi:L-fuculose-phosphate aldolase